MTPDLTNINSLWTSVLVEELIRHGVTQFVISPGSRSTPLVVAVANHRQANSVIHFDERGAAFFALGYGRATGRPAALICTSGTAVANYLPAVVEASMDCVPMILLTADRPPELRDIGANQTIRQPGIFSTYPRWEYDLSCPSNDIPLTFLLSKIDEAVAAATQTPAGPVHLNCMFREPLAPTRGEEDLCGYAEEVKQWTESSAPQSSVNRSLPRLSKDELRSIIEVLFPHCRGLLVIGALKSESERKAAAELADQLNWPLMADIGSGLRGGEVSNRVDYFDLMLASERFAETHQPDVVLQFGSRITSKRLLTFLQESPPDRYIQILDHPFKHDPIGKVTDRYQSEIAEACDQIVSLVKSSTNVAWLKAWKATSQIVDAFLEKEFASATMLTEPLVAHLLTSEIPLDSPVWAASSMPIRDLDLFCDPRANWFPVAANRGVAGIDGTVASAAGYAHGSHKRVTLLIGDLALLHDLNSLSLLSDKTIKLTVVVLNNDGGGIFGHLPIGQFGDLHERYFATPHGYQFNQAASMFGLAYDRVTTSQQFSESYRSAAKRDGSTLIEIPIDRNANLAFHQHLVHEIAARLDRGQA
jgi:2-succinyl-5-enolpyruvyl-6-hydroxy-3-cyclohexene-1-carboxylate synthase